MKSTTLFFILALFLISCQNKNKPNNNILQKTSTLSNNLKNSDLNSLIGEYKELGNNRNKFKIFKDEKQGFFYQSYIFGTDKTNEKKYKLEEISPSSLEQLIGSNSELFSSIWKINNLYIAVVKPNSVFKDQEMYGNNKIDSNYAVLSSDGHYMKFTKY